MENKEYKSFTLDEIMDYFVKGLNKGDYNYYPKDGKVLIEFLNRGEQ